MLNTSLLKKQPKAGVGGTAVEEFYRV